MNQDDYIKQLEETIESFKRKLERSEMRIEELIKENKNLAKEAPHIVPRKIGVDLVAGNLIIARSDGSVEYDDDGKNGVIKYDLEVFGESKMGYVTECMDNHIAEFDKMLRTGVVPKHLDRGHRAYTI